LPGKDLVVQSGIALVQTMSFILLAKGFKFYPKRNNQVRIIIDSQVVHKYLKVLQNGNVRSRLKVPRELAHGNHVIKIVQKLNHKDITATGSFVKAVMDEDEVDENET